MRILLTGGRGMVGKNFLHHSLASQHDILAPTSVELDLRDSQAVTQWMLKFQPELVIHAAGTVGGIQANIREPARFLLENLDMGRNVVWASKAAGVKKLINLGSSCMFPRNAPNPLREEMILQGELEPTNEGYALAKIAVARLCEYIAKEDPTCHYKTLIPCNIYGRFDKFDPVHSHMVPAIIKKLHDAKVSGQPTVDIWGDGMARREFLYAEDLADCMWRSVNHFDALPECMNVGLGVDYSVNEYYETAAKVIGYSGSFQHDLSKPVGMKQKLVNVERAQAWGWQARHSLEQGLSLTYQHYVKEYCA